MADIPRIPSREEHEFWDREFRDDRHPRRARRRPLGSESPVQRTVERLVDRVREWREDARFGV
ncbi:MAG: hypothetical protein ACHQDE_09450, partial [Acidimicrobiia bacterium]